MTSEALGVSVAPSFFQSCVSDGKTARMEDVLKFKVSSHVTFVLKNGFLNVFGFQVSTKIMQNIIDKFATHDIFGRDNYEYYARVTGRILKVQDEWICSFQYPPPPRGKLAQQKYACEWCKMIKVFNVTLKDQFGNLKTIRIDLGIHKL